MFIEDVIKQIAVTVTDDKSVRHFEKIFYAGPKHFDTPKPEPGPKRCPKPDPTYNSGVMQRTLNTVRSWWMMRRIAAVRKSAWHAKLNAGYLKGAMLTRAKLVKEFPTDVEALNQLGVSYLMVGNNQKARQVYEQVTRNVQ